MLCFVVAMVALACVMGASSAPCHENMDCVSCYANVSCQWATLQNCSTQCILLAYTDKTPSRSTPWRSRVAQSLNRSNTCSKYEICTIFADSVPNSGFEDTPKSWMEENSRSLPLICSPACADGSTQALSAFEGNQFVWFGGITANMDANLHQQVVIPKTATHLSFYVWSANFDSTTKSALEVFVDANLVFRLYKKNHDIFVGTYHVMQVDIQKFADGRSHLIKFHFLGIYQGSGTITSLFLDNVQLISSNMAGNTPYPFATLNLCSTGCARDDGYIEDNECDPACNNLQCDFDGGACESQLPGDKSSVCYSGRPPASKVHLPVCQQYIESTCCETLGTIEHIDDRIKELRNASLCTVEASCQDYLERMMCAKCSPLSAIYFSAGKLQVCMDYANKAWDSCKNSYTSDSRGGCMKIHAKWDDRPSEWIKDMKIGEYVYKSTNCFNGDDAVKKKTLSTGAIAGIVVGGVVVLALAVLIVFAVYWFALRPKPQKNTVMSATMVDTIDPGNVMTMVPIEMMPQMGGLVTQPAVVYTDQFGNIIPQDQLVAVTPMGQVSNSGDYVHTTGAPGFI